MSDEYETSSEDMMIYDRKEGRIVKKKAARMTRDDLIISDETIRNAVIYHVRKDNRNKAIDEEISDLQDEKKTLRKEQSELREEIRKEMVSRGLSRMTVGCQLIEIHEDDSVTITEIYVAK